MSTKSTPIKRILRPFRGLQGKLTLSYTLTSVVTFFLVEMVVLGIAFTIVTLNIPSFVVSSLSQEAPQAAPYFVHGSPDTEALTSWLHLVEGNVFSQGPLNRFSPIFIVVVDTQGKVVASTGTPPVPNGSQAQASLSEQSHLDLQSVLGDPSGKTTATGRGTNSTLSAAAPIVGEDGKLHGALVMQMVEPKLLELFFSFLGAVLVSVTFVSAVAAIAGSVFGYLTARGLTRRLKGLFVAADHWRSGDFSAVADDPSEDEIGQLARQLNLMAYQLQNLLQARQELATLEERNRLARDLHDSVKQQIFAVAMQIGAVKVLLKRDLVAAEVRLNEADKLVRQAQQELTALIRELRPAALEGKGLAAALRELTIEWAEQTGIVANLQVEGTQTIAAVVEDSLFRIAQEALSNVQRHGNATVVQMTLTIANDSVTLSVRDNGHGFDPTQQKRTGVGLLSMQERMRALGGDVQLESAPGEGTLVVAHCSRLGAEEEAVSPQPSAVS
jgi:NarL family two-component system sensor histidine kinase LiaS